MRPALALFALAAACGDEVAYRPLVVEVENLSAAAEVLVIKVIAGEGSCGVIDLSNVQSIATPYEARWIRDAGAERQIAIPKIDEDRAVVVVYTEDSRGVAIQLACSEIEYADIESGRITLRLSARTAGIISPWRMCSARSSSNGCSGGVEWRRSSSPAEPITRTRTRWS
jgi:hypothetical protein